MAKASVMREMRTPKQILARIEGWENASIVDLDGGLTNRTFLLTSGSRRAVLKIDAEPRGAPFNSRLAEARIQANAHDASLAPAVLFNDERCYLTEYVEGVTLSAEDLYSHDTLERLGKALRKLHALPPSGRSFDARGAAQLYAERINDPDRAMVGQRIEIIDSVPLAAAPRLCHNDLVAENILDTGELKFLDWEYACDNDPLFDLATLVAHHELDEAQTDTLLTAYFDGEWRTQRSRLESQVALYDALLWLWRAATLPAVTQLP